MANYGSGTGTPGGGTWFDVTGNKQYASNHGSWPGGLISEIDIYAAGYQASITAKFGIWTSGGSLQWSSAGHTWDTALQWRSNGVSDPVNGGPLYLGAGSQLKLGFWSAGHVQWKASSSGSAFARQGLSDIADFSSSFDEYGGQGLGDLAGYLVYTPVVAPTITSISPSVSPPGSTITINGSGFTGTGAAGSAGVTIGGVAASYTVNSDSSITATVPSSVGGVVTVTVSNPAGSDSASMTAGQVYFGTGSGVASIKAVWYGDPSGSGVPHKVAGVWVPKTGGGVKRVW